MWRHLAYELLNYLGDADPAALQLTQWKTEKHLRSTPICEYAKTLATTFISVGEITLYCFICLFRELSDIVQYFSR